MENNLMYIRRIRDLREDSDLTQQDVADILGTSQTMYARYERGASEMPIRHLITLCIHYNVTSDYILGLSDCKAQAKPPVRLSKRIKKAPAP